MVKRFASLTLFFLLGLAACGPPQTKVEQPRIAQATTTPPALESVLPFWGHRAPVEALTYSADGRRLFSAAGGEEVIMWDPVEGVPVRKYRAEVGPEITGLVVDPAGDYVAVADHQHIFFWNVHSGVLQKTVEMPTSNRPDERDLEIRAVVAASNSEFLLVGDNIGRLLILDIEAGSAQAIYRTPLESIEAIGNGNRWVAVADAQRTLIVDLTREPVPVPILGQLEGIGLRDIARYKKGLVASDGQHVILWGPDFTDSPRAFKGGGANHLAAEAGGNRAISASAEGELLMWDLKKRRQRELELTGALAPHLVAFDPEGVTLASAEQNAIVIRDAESGAVKHHLFNAIVPRFLMFEPGTHRFLLAGSDGRPARYDLHKPTTFEPFSEMSAPIVDGELDLEANGFYASTEQGDVAVFDYSKGRLAKVLDVDVGAHPHLALATGRAALVSEERGLNTESGKGELVVWDLAREEKISTLNVSDAIDLAFAPAGKRIFYATRSAMLESWDYESQQRKKVFDDLNNSANSLRLSPGGGLLAVCGDEGVSFLNQSLEQVYGVKLKNVVDVAFAYDGTRVVAATQDHGVYMVYFEGEGIRVEPIVETPTAVTALAISSDNHFLLVGEERGTVAVFDLRDDKVTPRVTLQIFDQERWVTFKPNGNFAGEPGEARFDLDGEIVEVIGGQVDWKRDAGAIYQALDVL